MKYAILVLAALYLIMAVAFTTSCPTEDSCQVEYHRGQWHIERIVP